MARRPSPHHDEPGYTERLVRRDSRWKRRLGAQIPYRANIRRVVEGRVLEIGCGTGRLLEMLGPEAMGVDTNPHSVAVAAERGLRAVTDNEFRESWSTAGFDTLVFAHVLEHMTNQAASALIARYLVHLVAGGRIVVIVPQEAGFRSDPTHVEAVDRAQLLEFADANRLEVEGIYSFPFPRPVGLWFRHNETVALMRAGDIRGRPDPIPYPGADAPE